VHTLVLSLSYLPGRAAAVLHGALHTITWDMRTDVAPLLLLVVLLVAATGRPQRWVAAP
jgi:hypothetical protein